MRAGDWEGAFDEARATEEAAAAHHEERAALLRARLESGMRKVSFPTPFTVLPRSTKALK